ncbi:MAG: hypothetical protein ACWGSQ_07265 [Longimicrobiales bacterium]
MSRTFTLLLALALLPPLQARAQEHITIRIIPRFGLLSPGAYFYEEFSSFAQDTPMEWTTGTLGRAAYVGLGAEVGWEDRGIFLRGEVGRSFEGWLSAVHSYVRPRILFEPPEIINTWIDVPAALNFASAQLILPTRVEFWRIRPYFFLGGGGKWYDFGDPTEPVTVDAILPSNGFTVNADFGGGVYWEVFGITFDLQARNALNRYWDKYQNDLIFSGGLVWTVH